MEGYKTFSFSLKYRNKLHVKNYSRYFDNIYIYVLSYFMGYTGIEPDHYAYKTL